jgi:hypothetical protein
MIVPTAYDRPPAHRAGIFRPELLDQGAIWIDERGREHQVAELQYDHACNLVLYLLTNARRFITLHANRENLDALQASLGEPDDALLPATVPYPQTGHEAKRRMMETLLMRAVLRRILGRYDPERMALRRDLNAADERTYAIERELRATQARLDEAEHELMHSRSLLDQAVDARAADRGHS